MTAGWLHAYTDTVLNQRKVDVGCPMFGNIVVVFATEWVQDMTVIAPMDTGAEMPLPMFHGRNGLLKLDTPCEN